MNIFPENARVCFVGDSITHNNGFVSHIVMYYNENLKERNVNFYNCGTAGGELATALSVFDDDIMVHRPTHAVIMLGMNDSSHASLAIKRGEERYNLLLTAFEKYKVNLNALCERFSAKGVEIILCTPTPYAEHQSSEVESLPGGFALIGAYADFVRSFAGEKVYVLCDFHACISEKAQSENVINPDRVHPNDLGHYYMAKYFLSLQGLEMGEMKPFPAYMKKWRSNLEILRDIRAAEYLVAKDYSLSTEERIRKMKEYIENAEDGPYKEYIIFLARRYIRNKPLQEKLEEETNYIMETEMKKAT